MDGGSFRGLVEGVLEAWWREGLFGGLVEGVIIRRIGGERDYSDDWWREEFIG